MFVVGGRYRCRNVDKSKEESKHTRQLALAVLLLLLILVPCFECLFAWFTDVSSTLVC